MAVADTVARPARSDSTFFPTMAVAMTATVLLGFARSFYLKPVFHAPPDLSLLMVVHGVAFTAWMAVLVIQTGFVANNRRDLHMKLGAFGAALAALMVVLGTWLAIDALQRGFSPVAGVPAKMFFAIPFFDMLVFAGIATAGILNRRRTAWHKRFMILATVAMLDAAVARIPLGFIENGGPPVFFGLCDLFIVAVALYDWSTLRRVHPATLWAGGAIVFSQVFRLWLSGTDQWQSFAGLFLH